MINVAITIMMTNVLIDQEILLQIIIVKLASIMVIIIASEKKNYAQVLVILMNAIVLLLLINNTSILKMIICAKILKLIYNAKLMMKSNVQKTDVLMVMKKKVTVLIKIMIVYIKVRKIPSFSFIPYILTLNIYNYNWKIIILKKTFFLLWIYIKFLYSFS